MVAAGEFPAFAAWSLFAYALPPTSNNYVPVRLVYLLLVLWTHAGHPNVHQCQAYGSTLVWQTLLPRSPGSWMTGTGHTVDHHTVFAE